MTEKRYLNIIPTGHIIDTKTDTIIRGSGISDLLNEKDERIKKLEETIDTIAKDYEISHGMNIRNAEWFTAW